MESLDKTMVGLPGPPAPKSLSSSSSSNSAINEKKETNTNNLKIRKHFPETWLWNWTDVGYSFLSF